MPEALQTATFCLHSTFAKYGDQWNWWKSMRTFTPAFLKSATAASSFRRNASSQWCFDPSGARASTVLHGAMIRTKFAPIPTALSYTTALEFTETFTPRRTTGEPDRVSTNCAPCVVTHGATVFVARCGRCTRWGFVEEDAQPAEISASVTTARASLVHMIPVYGRVPPWEAA